MDLKEIRKSIDDTDKKIALLLQKRMTLSKAVADYKIQNNITVHNEMREREVLENINHHVGSDYGKYIKPVYNSIMEASKAYQYSLMENTGDFVNSLKDANSCEAILRLEAPSHSMWRTSHSDRDRKSVV